MLGDGYDQILKHRPGGWLEAGCSPTRPTQWLGGTKLNPYVGPPRRPRRDSRVVSQRGRLAHRVGQHPDPIEVSRVQPDVAQNLPQALISGLHLTQWLLSAT